MLNQPNWHTGRTPPQNHLLDRKWRLLRRIKAMMDEGRIGLIVYRPWENKALQKMIQANLVVVRRESNNTTTNKNYAKLTPRGFKALEDRHLPAKPRRPARDKGPRRGA